MLSFPLGGGRPGVPLTLAERDVLVRALGGATNAEIAVGRGSSRRTVANQLGSIFKKLGVCSRAELAQRWACFDE